MAAGNNVTLVGNITEAPSVKYLASGSAVANFSLAVNRRWQKDGEWEEAVSFVECTVWSEQAENCAGLEKGTRVIVDGRIEQQSWDDKDTGAKRSKLVLVADEVGASMRWATVEVTRNPKKDGGGQQQRKADPGAYRPAPQQHPDEEPF